MIPSAPSMLAQIALPITPTILYEIPESTPGNTVAHITSMWVCNVDVSIRLMTQRYGKGTLTSLNALFEGAAIEPHRTYILFDGSPIKMTKGFRLEGFADVANTIVVTLFGEIWRG